MHVKQLVRNKKEYWDFVWPFVDWAGDSNRSLWREEDRPKLEPFFKMQNRYEEWTQEVKDSFDFYEKCRAEYGDKMKELRDAVSGFSPDEILQAFGYEIPEEGVEYGRYFPLCLEEDFEFPMVVIGELYCSWDRSGDIRVLSIYQVSLKDFNDET